MKRHQPPTVIAKVVAQAAGIDFDEMTRRTRAHVVARHVAARIAHRRGFSTLCIGRALRRDHSSVVVGLRRVAEHIAAGTERGLKAMALEAAAERLLAGEPEPRCEPARAAAPEPVAEPPPAPVVRPAPILRRAMPDGRIARHVGRHGYVNAAGEIIARP